LVALSAFFCFDSETDQAVRVQFPIKTIALHMKSTRSNFALVCGVYQSPGNLFLHIQPVRLLLRQLFHFLFKTFQTSKQLFYDQKAIAVPVSHGFTVAALPAMGVCPE
jgi:hypothetical protein